MSMEIHQLGTYQGRSYTIANGGRLEVETDADQMLITELSASDGVRLRLNNGPDGAAFKGFAATGPIRSIVLTNDNGASITAEIVIVKGLAVADRRVSLIGGSAPVQLESPDTLDSTADTSVAATTTAVVLAANSTRREALIQNLDGATTIRVGDASTGAAQGLAIPPLGVLTLTTTAAIYVYNPSGSAVLVALLEVAA